MGGLSFCVGFGRSIHERRYNFNISEKPGNDVGDTLLYAVSL